MFIKMDKRLNRLIGIAVFLLALAVGTGSQYQALVNEYIFQDDARQHIYWMEQFYDRGLFKNDLLTEYARNYQPWGFILLYYIFSFIIKPIIFSKILPIILFAISSLYIFKLIRHLKNNFSGFIGALLFMTTPIFLNRMVGGFPRAFAQPLLIAFLYYLIRKKYLRSSIILVLECLFYPITFFLSMFTYLFTFIKFENKKFFFEKSSGKVILFVSALFLSFVILSAKYIYSYSPSIGRTPTYSEMLDKSEFYSSGPYRVLPPDMPGFYSSGRYKVLPTDPLISRVVQDVEECIFGPLVKYKQYVMSFILILILFFFFEIFKKRILFPSEIWLFLLSSALMYEVSDLVIFRLFLPERYLEFSVNIVTLIILAVAISQLLDRVKNIKA